MWKAEILDKCPHSQGLCPHPDDAFLYSNTHSPFTHTHIYTHMHTHMETQTHSANNPTEGSICLGTRWPCCLGACEQAQWRPLILHTPSRLCCADDGWGGWVVGGITTPCNCSFKTLFKKPPEIAPFTPCTDGAKSLLVTQSHAVNRWSSYWVKDRAGRGGSPSIPAGNNGAAGQECCLQEEGSGRRGMLRQSRAMRVLWNWRNWENLIWVTGGGEEARGCMRSNPAGCRGSDSGGGGLCVNRVQQCLCLTSKQEQKDIPTHIHLHVQKKDRDLHFNAHFKDNCFRHLNVSLHKKLHVKHRQLHCW